MSEHKKTFQQWCEENDELRARIAKLEAIVEKLPKTADGVPVVPGQDVFDYNRYEVFVRHVEMEAFEYDDDGGKCAFGGIHDCYSTREAAEAAKEEGE